MGAYMGPFLSPLCFRPEDDSHGGGLGYNGLREFSCERWSDRLVIDGVSGGEEDETSTSVPDRFSSMSKNPLPVMAPVVVKGLILLLTDNSMNSLK